MHSHERLLVLKDQSVFVSFTPTLNCQLQTFPYEVSLIDCLGFFALRILTAKSRFPLLYTAPLEVMNAPQTVSKGVGFSP
jgi:hypothetical protein